MEALLCQVIAENLCEIFFWVSAVLWAGGFWRLCTARAAFDFLQNALALLSSVTVLRLSGPKNQGPESQVPTLSKGSFGNSKAARAAPQLQSSAASQKALSRNHEKYSTKYLWKETRRQIMALPSSRRSEAQSPFLQARQFPLRLPVSPLTSFTVRIALSSRVMP